MANSDPIGIFDSGIGGLSVAKSIRERLPNEQLLYIADSYHAPYGDKSTAFVEHRSHTLVQLLIEQRCKAIVVACNTATTAAIHQLRCQFSIPIIGVEPGVKPAINSTQSGVIGVLATKQTLASDGFNRLVERFSDSHRVETQACVGLVEQIESINLDGHETVSLLQRYISPLLDKGVDTLVLGCTHYAFLEPLIRQLVGEQVRIINTSTAIAEETHRRLGEENLLSDLSQSGGEAFLTSSDAAESSEVFSRLWGRVVEVRGI
ncbi:MAG: glutamate racemase [Halopseudomonas sp.]